MTRIDRIWVCLMFAGTETHISYLSASMATFMVHLALNGAFALVFATLWNTSAAVKP
jgi:hypothetical protein